MITLKATNPENNGKKMTAQSALDCILVGYNDVDFEQFVSKQKKMARYTGAYHEIVTNSVLLHGKRTTYMDLINHAVTRATGKNPRLNAFEAPSLGCCYLKSYLKQRDYEVEIVNFFSPQRDDLRELLSRSPRSVAITTTYYIDNAPIIEIVQIRAENTVRPRKSSLAARISTIFPAISIRSARSTYSVRLARTFS